MFISRVRKVHTLPEQVAVVPSLATSEGSEGEAILMRRKWMVEMGADPDEIEQSLVDVPAIDLLEETEQFDALRNAHAILRQLETGA